MTIESEALALLREARDHMWHGRYNHATEIIDALLAKNAAPQESRPGSLPLHGKATEIVPAVAAPKWKFGYRWCESCDCKCQAGWCLANDACGQIDSGIKPHSADLPLKANAINVTLRAPAQQELPQFMKSGAIPCPLCGQCATTAINATRYERLRTYKVGLGLQTHPTWFTGDDLDKMLDHEERMEARGK